MVLERNIHCNVSKLAILRILATIIKVITDIEPCILAFVLAHKLCSLLSPSLFAQLRKFVPRAFAMSPLRTFPTAKAAGPNLQDVATLIKDDKGNFCCPNCSSNIYIIILFYS